MVRDNKIALLLNDDEYAELKKRSKEAHLPLAAYCRSFLLTERKEIAYISTPRDIDIKRLKKPEPPPDPYLEEKQKSHAMFKKEVQSELFNKLSLENPLDPIHTDILDDMKKRRNERFLMIEELKKDIESGIFNA